MKIDILKAALLAGLLAGLVAPVAADTVFSIHGRNDCATQPWADGPSLMLDAGVHPLAYQSGAWSLWNSDGQNGGQTWVTGVYAYVHATAEAVPLFGTGFHPSQASAQAAAAGLLAELDLPMSSQVTFYVQDGGGCGDNRGQVTLALLDQVVAASDLPGDFVLSPAAPNPFNPTTTLCYSLDETGPARLAVFDLLGREVAVLHEGLASAGEHAVVFDAADLPGGLYFARLVAADRQAVRKLLLVK